MATVSASISSINTYFTSIINDLMVLERQPLTVLQTRKTNLEKKNSVFTDLGSKFSALQSATDELNSDTGLAVFDNRTATVAAAASGKTVLTASASNGASAATYTINVTALAVQHTVGSDQQSSASQSLGLDGTFTLRGTDITISNSDTLNGIASKINKASYSSGNGVKATVIDRKLILTADETGNDITASDKSGTVLQSLGVLDTGGFKNLIHAKSLATFSINGLPESTAVSNQGITAIGGVTFNLAADAAMQTATITVAADNSSIRNKVQDFLTKINDLTTYLGDKSSITSSTDAQGKTTYTRGTLADDYSYVSLRTDLVNELSGSFYGLPSGAATMLNEIGITLDDNSKFIIKDSTKLENALMSNPVNTQSLLQKVSSKVDSMLEQFTGTAGTLTYSQKSITDEISSVNAEVADTNTYLTERQASFEKYYGSMQTQVINNYYLQQELSSFSSLNVLG